MKKILVLSFILSFSPLIAQNYKILSKWDKIAKKIDATCKKIDSQKNTFESIAEGENQTLSSAFEIYTLKQEQTNEIIRIIYNSSDSFYTKKTYYYSNQKLIKYILDLSVKGKTNQISYYYFKDEKLIKTIGHKMNTLEVEQTINESNKIKANG